jgi:hypothetical protein
MELEGLVSGVPLKSLCKNPSQMITCVVGAVEALSTQQGSVTIEGL